MGRQRQCHYVASVPEEGGALLASFNVPQSARHVTGTGYYLEGRKVWLENVPQKYKLRTHLIIIQEAAAGQVPSVSWQFS